MKVILFIFLLCLAVNAQSSDELRQKYGAPTAETYSEVYSARPYNETTKLSVSVTATYSKNKEVISLLVEIFPFAVKRDTPTTKEEDELKTKLLDEVVDEIIPKEKRGKNIINGFVSLGCLPDDDCFGSLERYEKVSIYFNGNSHRYARITWRNNTLK